jgi:hypothetical protein
MTQARKTIDVNTNVKFVKGVIENLDFANTVQSLTVTGTVGN